MNFIIDLTFNGKFDKIVHRNLTTACYTKPVDFRASVTNL